MRKPSIQSTGGVQDKQTSRILMALKENVDVMTGAVGGELAVLAPDATLPEVITKVNEIIRRLNRSGT